MYYFKTLYIFFFFIALNLFFFSTANVSAKSFQVDEIEISEPFREKFDKNSVIDKGFRNAFFKLINLLVKSNDFNKVKSIRLNEIKSMIESFTIQDEKFIDETYYLKIGVNFDKRKIYNYLEKKNIFPSQIKNEKFLFLPLIIDENNNNIIIYSDNPIYEKWNLDTNKNYLINFLLPTEDLEDLNFIKNNIDNIENYNFQEIIKKYYLNNSIISIIFKNKDDIKVLSKIYIEDKEIILNNTFKSYNFNNKEELNYFIEELKMIYEDLWKKQNEINTSIKLPLIIKIDNQNLSISLKIENIFKEIDLISYYSIKNFDKDYIYYEIIFNGTPQNFIKIMNDRNYNFDIQNKIWILK
ncbi:hypothetical protein IDH11_00480 [Pelagibacterales bacterium SAG-MED30]|nr:hypothetical protein [Pelagibacterales bacterium SAG-MED30]|tara:strand:+ start:806 stop:1867 length:1062 start_codon:yes stop_codon:yes gene_type:complete